MDFKPARLKDVWLISLNRIGDDRGFFARTFCEEEFSAKGLPTQFVQQNMSLSNVKGTLRGFHFQKFPHDEDKLIRCVNGAIFDVVIDLRPDSDSYLQWESFELSDSNKDQLLIPKGFAHGFQVLSDRAEVSYLVSNKYAPKAERGIRWDDPSFKVDWPLPPTEISDKDRNWPNFAA